MVHAAAIVAHACVHRIVHGGLELEIGISRSFVPCVIRSRRCRQEGRHEPRRCRGLLSWRARAMRQRRMMGALTVINIIRRAIKCFRGDEAGESRSRVSSAAGEVADDGVRDYFVRASLCRHIDTMKSRPSMPLRRPSQLNNRQNIGRNKQMPIAF